MIRLTKYRVLGGRVLLLILALAASYTITLSVIVACLRIYRVYFSDQPESQPEKQHYLNQPDQTGIREQDFADRNRLSQIH